jgi:hypothetical protein
MTLTSSVIIVWLLIGLVIGGLAPRNLVRWCGLSPVVLSRFRAAARSRRGPVHLWPQLGQTGLGGVHQG